MSKHLAVALCVNAWIIGAIFFCHPLHAQQTTITIDGTTGETTQTFSRPPCQATLDAPLPVTDANIESYRFTGTCTADTFASVRNVDDPAKRSSRTATLSCKDERILSEILSWLQSIDGRKSKRLEVYVNDGAGLCSEAQSFEFRATYFEDADDRPLPAVPTANLDSERGGEVARIIELRPGLVAMAWSNLEAKFGVISIGRGRNLPFTKRQLECALTKLDDQSLNQRDRDSVAHVATRDNIDLETLRTIRTYFESDAGSATKKKMQRDIAFIKHLRSGKPFEDFFKGTDPNMERDAAKRQAMEAALAEERARNKATTDAFLSNAVVAKAYQRITDGLQRDQTDARAPARALRVAMKSCGAK